MRTRTIVLAVLLGVGLAPAVRAQDGPPAAAPDATALAAPGQPVLVPPPSFDYVARGQDYAPPDPQLPLPLYHDRPDGGGFYFAGEFLLFRQTNPLSHQVVAFRGFFDADGSVSAALGRPARPGTLIGSGTPVLRTSDVGNETYQPGFAVSMGWRFRSGFVLEANWWHLIENKYAATAGIEPFHFRAGPTLADTFVSSFVFNFPAEFAGARNQLGIGNPGAGFGIWNAASNMNIQFVQRFDQFDLNGRVPMFETDDHRFYGVGGLRAVAMWERFWWRTVDLDSNSFADATDAAIYSNVVSNRLYGFDIGCGDEWRLGDTPAGTFSLSLDVRTAMFLDIVKNTVKYERADRNIAAKTARRDYTLVPELQASLNLWWYPIEGVQLRVGYNTMAFFNTLSSPNPVDFNFGTITPDLERTFRFFDGINAGIGFIF